MSNANGQKAKPKRLRPSVAKPKPTYGVVEFAGADEKKFKLPVQENPGATRT